MLSRGILPIPSFIIKTYTVHWNLPLLYLYKSVYLWSAMLVHEVKGKRNQLFKSLNTLLPSPRREGSMGICALSHHSDHSDRKWCHMEARIYRFAPWYMISPLVMSDLGLIVWLSQLFQTFLVDLTFIETYWYSKVNEMWMKLCKLVSVWIRAMCPSEIS